MFILVITTHLGEEDVLEEASLLAELRLPGGIASNKVLEDAAVGCVGHFG